MNRPRPPNLPPRNRPVASSWTPNQQHQQQVFTSASIRLPPHQQHFGGGVSNRNQSTPFHSHLFGQSQSHASINQSPFTFSQQQAMQLQQRTAAAPLARSGTTATTNSSSSQFMPKVESPPESSLQIDVDEGDESR